MKELEKSILELKKKYGEQSIGKVSGLDHVNLERISTGSHYLDWATGGGLPRGRTVELYGPYSSGKTLIALRTIKTAQENGLDCVFIDVERAFDPEFAEHLGIDLDKLILVRETRGEYVFNIIDDLLEAGPDIIVLDSVASLVPEYEEENPIEKQTMALQARLMSKALRKLTGKIGKSNTLLIFINQIREKVQAYGNPETTSGGRALGFYSSLRLEVRRGDWITKNKKKIGQMIKFRITKSKICPAWTEGSFKYYYSGEFDEEDELINLGIESGIIERRGSYYDFKEESFHGTDSLKKELSKNERLFSELRKEVINNDEIQKSKSNEGTTE